MEPLKILIVDDDPDLANLIRFKLKQEAPNFSITFVDGGNECLEYLETNNVDCILSDFQMPGMSGMELLQTLRQRGNDIPFIFITGQGNENVAREAFKEGADDYFTKDFGFARFAKIINSVENAIKHRNVERSHMICEEALRESETRHLAFIANSSEGILRYETDTPVSTSLTEDEQIELFFRHAYLAECNDAGARMYGLEKSEQIIGVLLADILDRSDPRNIELLRAFIRSGYRLVNSESYNKDRNGNIHCILNSFIGEVENGFLVRAWGVDRDISEQKKMEETLKRSEERYRSFVANSPEAIWRFEIARPFSTSLPEDEQIKQIHQHAYLAECNDVLVRMLGASRAEDIVGKKLRDIVPPEDPFNIEHQLKWIRSGYRLVNNLAHIKDVTGNILHVRGTSTGIVENGCLLRAWGVTTLDDSSN